MKLFCKHKKKKRKEKREKGDQEKATPRPTHFLVHKSFHHKFLGVPVLHTQQMSGGLFVVLDALLCLKIPTTHSMQGQNEANALQVEHKNYHSKCFLFGCSVQDNIYALGKADKKHSTIRSFPNTAFEMPMFQLFVNRKMNKTILYEYLSWETWAVFPT